MTTPVAAALFGLALPLVAFVPLALQAWRKQVPDWDRTLSEWIHAYENESTFLNRYVDVLGLPLHWSVQALGVVILMGAAVISLYNRRRRSSAFLLVALVGAIALTPVLKEIFATPPVDPRPNRGEPTRFPGSGHAFPSGHALRAVVLAAAVVAVTHGRPRRLVLLLGTLSAFAIGVGVVYHEWHWTSDVLGGWLVGIALTTLLWLILRPDRDRPIAASA